MTLTERGYATIEMVGLLERAKDYVTEVYTPVCRADFGDARCKVDLNGNDPTGNPITQHVLLIGYDGGYVIDVSCCAPFARERMLSFAGREIGRNFQA